MGVVAPAKGDNFPEEEGGGEREQPELPGSSADLLRYYEYTLLGKLPRSRAWPWPSRCVVLCYAASSPPTQCSRTDMLMVSSVGLLQMPGPGVKIVAFST